MIINRLPSGGGNTKIIARAIGNPAAERDKPEALAGIIDAAQADIAALCNERGCNIPADPTFSDIIDGIQSITHFTRPAQVSNLAAAGAHDTAGLVDVSWTNPPGDSNFRGVRVMYKAGGYPSNATDGTVGYDGTGTSIRLSGLTNGTLYYIRAFAYNLVDGAYIYNTQTIGAQCTCTPTLNAPPQVSGLAVTVGSTVSGYMRVTWTNPTAATFKGVRVVYKVGSYPTSPTDGTLLYAGTGTAAEKTGLTNGTAYYVRAFAYNLSNGVYSYNNQSSGAQASGIPYVNQGKAVFTESTTWTVPAGVTSVDVFLVGGGMGGNGGKQYKYTGEYTGAGGTSGHTQYAKKITVTPGQSIAVIIGAGGLGGLTGAENSYNGAPKPRYGAEGGSSTFLGYTAKGGEKHRFAVDEQGNYAQFAGNGGSGGSDGEYRYADGGTYNRYKDKLSGSGGSDGSNGYGNSKRGVPAILLSNTDYHGQGQRTTTREFGEASNTLYAGGGGPGRIDDAVSNGNGGDGGGGSGAYQYWDGSAWHYFSGAAGIPNTGSGGGGAKEYAAHQALGSQALTKYAGDGGSGLCIVRWGY